ncbi:transposase [Escherichia coli]|nr:transposase [Escherichia coli]
MGVWGSPQTVSGSAQGAAGTVAARFFLENGEQKHAKEFEAAKEQCRIDNHGQNVNT